MLKNFTV